METENSCLGFYNQEPCNVQAFSCLYEVVSYVNEIYWANDGVWKYSKFVWGCVICQWNLLGQWWRVEVFQVCVRLCCMSMKSTAPMMACGSIPSLCEVVLYVNEIYWANDGVWKYSKFVWGCVVCQWNLLGQWWRVEVFQVCVRLCCMSMKSTGPMMACGSIPSLCEVVSYVNEIYRANDGVWKYSKFVWGCVVCQLNLPGQWWRVEVFQVCVRLCRMSMKSTGPMMACGSIPSLCEVVSSVNEIYRANDGVWKYSKFVWGCVVCQLNLPGQSTGPMMACGSIPSLCEVVSSVNEIYRANDGVWKYSKFVWGCVVCQWNLPGQWWRVEVFQVCVRLCHMSMKSTGPMMACGSIPSLCEVVSSVNEIYWANDGLWKHSKFVWGCVVCQWNLPGQWWRVEVFQVCVRLCHMSMKSTGPMMACGSIPSLCEVVSYVNEIYWANDGLWKHSKFVWGCVICQWNLPGQWWPVEAFQVCVRLCRLSMKSTGPMMACGSIPSLCEVVSYVNEIYRANDGVWKYSKFVWGCVICQWNLPGQWWPVEAFQVCVRLCHLSMKSTRPMMACGSIPSLCEVVSSVNEIYRANDGVWKYSKFVWGCVICQWNLPGQWWRVEVFQVCVRLCHMSMKSTGPMMACGSIPSLCEVVSSVNEIYRAIDGLWKHSKFVWGCVVCQWNLPGQWWRVEVFQVCVRLCHMSMKSTGPMMACGSIPSLCEVVSYVNEIYWANDGVWKYSKFVWGCVICQWNLLGQWWRVEVFQVCVRLCHMSMKSTGPMMACGSIPSLCEVVSYVNEIYWANDGLWKHSKFVWGCVICQWNLPGQWWPVEAFQVCVRLCRLSMKSTGCRVEVFQVCVRLCLSMKSTGPMMACGSIPSLCEVVSYVNEIYRANDGVWKYSKFVWGCVICQWNLLGQWWRVEVFQVCVRLCHMSMKSTGPMMACGSIPSLCEVVSSVNEIYRANDGLWKHSKFVWGCVVCQWNLPGQWWRVEVFQVCVRLCHMSMKSTGPMMACGSIPSLCEVVSYVNEIYRANDGLWKHSKFVWGCVICQWNLPGQWWPVEAFQVCVRLCRLSMKSTGPMMACGSIPSLCEVVSYVNEIYRANDGVWKYSKFVWGCVICQWNLLGQWWPVEAFQVCVRLCHLSMKSTGPMMACGSIPSLCEVVLSVNEIYRANDGVWKYSKFVWGCVICQWNLPGQWWRVEVFQVCVRLCHMSMKSTGPMMACGSIPSLCEVVSYVNEIYWANDGVWKYSKFVWGCVICQWNLLGQWWRVEVFQVCVRLCHMSMKSMGQWWPVEAFQVCVRLCHLSMKSTGPMMACGSIPSLCEVVSSVNEIYRANDGVWKYSKFVWGCVICQWNLPGQWWRVEVFQVCVRLCHMSMKSTGPMMACGSIPSLCEVVSYVNEIYWANDGVWKYSKFVWGCVVCQWNLPGQWWRVEVFQVCVRLCHMSMKSTGPMMACGSIPSLCEVVSSVNEIYRANDGVWKYSKFVWGCVICQWNLLGQWWRVEASVTSTPGPLSDTAQVIQFQFNSYSFNLFQIWSMIIKWPIR